MKQKKLLLLGGLRYLIPVIEEAHRLGIYVITCDYLPDNIAHRYSDEYHNVSIVDKEAVLALSRELQIDGILSFAVDPGVVTAAYVQEQMGLPSMGPYESVRILQNKDLFRAFLKEHNFNVPEARSYASREDALADTDWVKWPMIVKPTDSAGSKGVKRVDGIEDYELAVDNAFACSLSKHIIVEQFIEKVGCSSDCDCFLQDGKWKVITFNSQRFDNFASNPYTPAGFSWPSTFTHEQELYLSDELQRLMTLLKMNSSVFNVETRVGVDGNPYIMECSPRGGGNRLCEMVRNALGYDLIKAQIQCSVGIPVDDLVPMNIQGHWVEIILHSEAGGRFCGLAIADDMMQYVIEKDIWVKSGDAVFGFNGANNSIGTLVMRFEDSQQVDKAFASQNDWMKVVIE